MGVQCGGSDAFSGVTANPAVGFASDLLVRAGATAKGLIFAATPASDFICGTLQLASGMTLQVFTTGRGTPYGLAAAPVIKMATRSNLAASWHDLIDLDAGRIATGEATVEEVGWELFRMILDVASGTKKPWSDRWGLYNAFALFNPAPVTRAFGPVRVPRRAGWRRESAGDWPAPSSLSLRDGRDRGPCR